MNALLGEHYQGPQINGPKALMDTLLLKGLWNGRQRLRQDRAVKDLKDKVTDLQSQLGQPDGFQGGGGSLVRQISSEPIEHN